MSVTAIKRNDFRANVTCVCVYVCVCNATLTSMEFGERCGEAADDKRFFFIALLELSYATTPGARTSPVRFNISGIDKVNVLETYMYIYFFLDIIFSFSEYIYLREGDHLPRIRY